MNRNTHISHRQVNANGLSMHIAEAGEGPLVLLCHGFPECWYSWHHQLLALAEAGYHAVAPDMRGYGLTEAPAQASQYGIFQLVGDVVGLMDVLQAPRAAVVGHDWGAPVAWHTALLRPDRVAAVAGFSVPYFPRSPTRPSMAMPREGGREFYQAYFCREGLAEAEFGADVRGTLRDFNWLWSGDNPDHSTEHLTMVREGGPMREGRSAPAVLPGWVSEADIDVYEQAFKASGFTGPLNWYRQIDRNWEQTAAFTGAQIRTPALYMVGEHDLLLRFKAMDKLLPNLERVIPGLTAKIIEPGCGHWIQRERVQRVNEELLRLLAAHWPA